MHSPFPGMNPWLERHWRDVHASLMVYARNEIEEQLPDDLLARVEEGISIDSEVIHRIVHPDVRVVEEHPAPAESETESLFDLGGGTAVATETITVAEPVEAYPIALREPLPAIPIPLRPRDRDVVLRLQELVERCYRRGRYSRIDYTQQPVPPLSREDAAWAAERVAAWSAGRSP